MCEHKETFKDFAETHNESYIIHRCKECKEIVHKREETIEDIKELSLESRISKIERKILEIDEALDSLFCELKITR